MLDSAPAPNKATVKPGRTTALIVGDLRDANWRAKRCMVNDHRYAGIHAEINALLTELQCVSL